MPKKTQWKRRRSVLPPHEEKVFGWDAVRGLTVCRYIERFPSESYWTVNGASGGSIKPPTMWTDDFSYPAEAGPRKKTAPPTKMQKGVCVKCDREKNIKSKGMCTTCYNDQYYFKGRCVHCNGVKAIRGLGLCHSCYSYKEIRDEYRKEK